MAFGLNRSVRASAAITASAPGAVGRPQHRADVAGLLDALHDDHERVGRQRRAPRGRAAGSGRPRRCLRPGRRRSSLREDGLGHRDGWRCPSAARPVEHGPRVRAGEQWLADERLDERGAGLEARRTSRAPSTTRQTGPIALAPVAQRHGRLDPAGWPCSSGAAGRGRAIDASCPARPAREGPELEPAAVARWSTARSPGSIESASPAERRRRSSPARRSPSNPGECAVSRTNPSGSSSVAAPSQERWRSSSSRHGLSARAVAVARWVEDDPVVPAASPDLAFDERRRRRPRSSGSGGRRARTVRRSCRGPGDRRAGAVDVGHAPRRPRPSRGSPGPCRRSRFSTAGGGASHRPPRPPAVPHLRSRATAASRGAPGTARPGRPRSGGARGSGRRARSARVQRLSLAGPAAIAIEPEVGVAPALGIAARPERRRMGPVHDAGRRTVRAARRRPHRAARTTSGAARRDHDVQAGRARSTRAVGCAAGAAAGRPASRARTRRGITRRSSDPSHPAQPGCQIAGRR